MEESRPPREAMLGSETTSVAVIVPSYNHARYIEECLRSIFRQSYAPARLLVIDDGSQDGSPEIIEQVLKECPFPSELIVRENRGLCATLNEGLARTTEELFAYLGSDDTWLPDRLQAGVDALQRRPEAVLAYSDTYVIDESGVVIGSTQDWQPLRDGYILPDLLRTESIPPSTTVLYRRAPLAEHGWNESSRLEDYENYLVLAAQGPFAYIPRVLGHWREHGKNTSKDVAMVMEAYLEAQDRLATELGLSRAELRQYSASVRFRYADYFLGAGDRGRAIGLTLGGLRGAPSWRAVVRRAARLATPAAALRWRKECLTRKARQRYALQAAPKLESSVRAGSERSWP